jgi:hypothetical protein
VLRLLTLATQRGPALSRGELSLTLNPRCLAFLANVFGEYETTGMFSHELSSHSDLVALYSFFLRLPALVIQPTARGAEEPLLDLNVFVGLTSLQLSDLVTPSLVLPPSLKERLQQLSVRGMLHSAAGLELGVEAWPRLRRLDLSHNFLTSVPSEEGINGLDVSTLNLSHNLLSQMPPLDRCLKLERLNLSFNRIPDVANIKECVGGIKSLSLQSNSLVSSAGVQFLMALQSLDLRDNSLTAWEDVKLLRRLPFLTDLWLVGNPLCHTASYRLDVFRVVCVHNEIRDSPQMALDGTPPTKSEAAELTALELQTPVVFNSPPPSSFRKIPTMTSPAQTPTVVGSRIPASSLAAASSVTGASSYSGSGSLILQGATREKVKKKKSAVVVLEAEPYKPRALEQLEPAVIVPVVTESEQVAQEAEQFAEKVKRLHEEGGSKWLVILDGMEKEEASASGPTRSPRKSGGAHHRRRSSGNSTKHAIEKPVEEKREEKKEEVTEEKKEPDEPRPVVLVVTMETESETVSVQAPVVVAPSAPAPVVSPRDSVAIAPVIVSAPGARETRRGFANFPLVKKTSPRLSKMGLGRDSRSRIDQPPQPQQQVESEFLVLRQNKATGEYDTQRVLMIGASRITEADVEHGETVVTLDTSGLCSVETIEFSDGNDMGPVVQLEFQLPGESSKTAYAWRTLDAIDGGKFLARCKALLAKNAKPGTKGGRSKCISCNRVFEGSVAKCPHCQSAYVVAVSDSNGNGNASVVESASSNATPASAAIAAGGVSDAAMSSFSRLSGALSTSGSSSGVATLGEFVARKDLEHGLEVFLKLKILVDASHEGFVFLARSDTAIVTERSPLDLERPLWVLLTTERMYVLSLNQDTSSGYGFAVVNSFLLSSFVRVTVGLFMSWIRFDGPSCVLCYTGSHWKTHRMLDAARDHLPKALVMHVGASSASVIQRSVLSGSNLILYARVRSRRRNRRATMLFSAASEWRSLIVSEDVVVLCDEDAGRWFVHTGGAPVFTEQQQHSLIDVSCLVNDGECGVIVEFDSDVKHVSSWVIEFASPQDKLRSVHVLSEAWSKQMGGLHLEQKQ